ncbi:hypothetical protein GCM10017776_10690 [Streptomyces griseoluteus]|nr:hypothetical protein GCM10017776_10690 [Streptomyces griseoluteus]
MAAGGLQTRAAPPPLHVRTAIRVNRAAVTDDSHFVARDRMGRLMSFTARAVKEGLTAGGKAWGVGVNEGSGSLHLDARARRRSTAPTPTSSPPTTSPSGRSPASR